jgi:hypothetical protein
VFALLWGWLALLSAMCLALETSAPPPRNGSVRRVHVGNGEITGMLQDAVRDEKSVLSRSGSVQSKIAQLLTM